MSLKRCLADTACYKKRVARVCLFTIVKYDKGISKNSLKNQEDLDEKSIQINEPEHKIMKKLPESNEYDMSWWRTCEEHCKLMCGYYAGLITD